MGFLGVRALAILSDSFMFVGEGINQVIGTDSEEMREYQLPGAGDSLGDHSRKREKLLQNPKESHRGQCTYQNIEQERVEEI